MIKIAILGFGVVGSGVYEIIRKNADSIQRKTGEAIDIKYIIDIRDFSSHPEKDLFTSDFEKVLNDKEVGIVAEVIGGIKPSYEYTKRLLSAGKSVVTSNKELVAQYGDELLELAENNGASYLFEASVGGGIPIIRPLSQCLAANEITQIVGILNGTTNYILTQMIKNGKSFDAALKEAQDNGYAERDPSADVDGHDACRKICILSSLACRKHVACDKVRTVGIRNLTKRDVEYAKELGCVIKLLGYCDLTGELLDVKVAPMLISKSNPLSTVEDVFNGILVKGDAVGDTMFYGRGAGKLPTASAVVADIIDIAKNSGKISRLSWKKTTEKVVADSEDSVSRFFVTVETSSKSATSDEIRKLFDNVTIIDKFENELGFTTDLISLGKLKEMLTSLSAKVINTLEIL